MVNNKLSLSFKVIQLFAFRSPKFPAVCKCLNNNFDDNKKKSHQDCRESLVSNLHGAHFIQVCGTSNDVRFQKNLPANLFSQIYDVCHICGKCWCWPVQFEVGLRTPNNPYYQWIYYDTVDEGHCAISCESQAGVPDLRHVLCNLT